jgi:NADPH-dependent 2,4-dienoyl-CoA reductase/sulfur reductase-like enzyme
MQSKLQHVVLLLMIMMTLKGVTAAVTQRTEHCDVVVAGGSTAALAAAVAAARDDGQLHVCLTEPTDWLGGQMTSSGVPAFDFGPLNRRAEFQPRDFAELVSSLGAGNHASCWVRLWILPLIGIFIQQ